MNYHQTPSRKAQLELATNCLKTPLGERKDHHSMEKSSAKKWLKASTILYIVILTMVAIASFAWFVFDDTATLETSNNMVITAGNKLEITLLDEGGNPTKDFGSKITLNTNASFSYPDITGNGITFFYPKALDTTDQPFYNMTDTFHIINTADKVERDQYFITVSLQFRTTTPMDIYLADTSYVSGMNEYTGANASNLSAYGNFSRDAIAGAARVAFLENQATGDILKNVWIPNDRFEIDYVTPTEATQFQGSNPNAIKDENGEMAIFKADGQREALEKIVYLSDTGGKYDLIPYGTLEKDTTYLNKPGPDNFLNRLVTLGHKDLATKNSEDGQTERPPMINNSAVLLSFTADEIREGGGASVKNLTVRIWIEGTDREADKATIGGKLKFRFEFIGIQKNDSKYNANNIQYDASSKTLTYNMQSMDGQETPSTPDLHYSENGIDWKPYSNTVMLSEGTTRFYVRCAETLNEKASDYKEISISN